MDSNVLIVGYGVVGTHLKEEISLLNPDICDKYKGIQKPKDKYKCGFICVDTPLVDGVLDIIEVENAINENDCELYVVKSTCPIGTNEYLRGITNKRIVFSPEFYGGTQHCNNFFYNYTVIGGEKEDCIQVIQILQDAYDARHSFRITDARTAEMLKFMSNSWLATKVTFCNSMYRAAKKANVNYEELRELFVLDPRYSPAHTFVYKEHPYYKSHCLDKDVPSFANQLDIPLLFTVISINSQFRNERF